MNTPESHGDGDICPPQKTQLPQPTSDPDQPWVRYRVEYRSVGTDELVDQRSTRDPHGELWNDNKVNAEGWPVFEVVKTIKVQDAEPERSRRGDTQHSIPPAATLAPSYSIRIYSTDIINAIQSVVRYYPGQDLTGDSVLIQWPYPILVHHYEELEFFLTEVNKLEPEQRCSREQSVNRHLRLLLDYLDDNVMADVREENERNKRGSYTYQWFWVHLRPGETILAEVKSELEPYASVIHSLEGGTFVNPSQPWTINHWRMDFNGEVLGRTFENFHLTKWDGESFDASRRLVRFPEQSESKELDDIAFDDDIKRFIRRGKAYWKLLTKQCQWHGGKTVDFPYNQVDTNVMLDVEACLVGGHMRKPMLMSDDDLREWTSDCTCRVCNIRRATGNEEIPLFENYNEINPKAYKDGLSWHQMFLCPGTIPAFIFRTRNWERLYVQNLSEPIFNQHMIDSLVMEPVQLRRLKALACSFARIDKNGSQLVHQAWSADFVKGKGQGLIFLLHGRPGVGKTCTAGFLRALEFYDGILFLTTNRVGAFDDAFISRIHIQLYYPDFTDDQRQQVWQTFVDKLKRDCGSYMKLDSTAKSYLKSKEVRAMKWNGRDIRNVSLAEYDAEEDDDGKVLVTDDHFRAVVELSSDFRKYLDTLHKKDEAQRAAFKHERYDEFVKDRE